MSETEKIYARYRNQVEHENILYDKRMTWLITLNSFLFAGMSILSVELFAKGTLVHGAAFFLIAILCVTGILFSLSIKRNLDDTRTALGRLRANWDNYAAQAKGIGKHDYPHPSGVNDPLSPGVILRTRNLAAMFSLLWLIIAVIFAGYFSQSYCKCLGGHSCQTPSQP